MSCFHPGVGVQPLPVAGGIGSKLRPPVLEQQGQHRLKCGGNGVIGQPVGNVRSVFTIRCVGQLHTLDPASDVGGALFHQRCGVRIAPEVRVHRRDQTQVGNTDAPAHHIGVALEVNVKSFKQFFVGSLNGWNGLRRDSQCWQAGTEEVHDAPAGATPCFTIRTGIQSTPKLGLQEQFLLVAVAPAVVHGDLQHAFQAKTIDQSCHRKLNRRAGRHQLVWRKCVERVQVSHDVRGILNEFSIRSFEHRESHHSDRRSHARFVIRMRRTALDERKPFLDQAGPCFTGVERVRRAP